MSEQSECLLTPSKSRRSGPRRKAALPLFPERTPMPPRWSRPSTREMQTVYVTASQARLRWQPSDPTMPHRELYRRLVVRDQAPDGPWAAWSEAWTARLKRRSEKNRAGLERAAKRLGCTPEDWSRFIMPSIHFCTEGDMPSRMPAATDDDRRNFIARHQQYATLSVRLSFLDEAIRRQEPLAPASPGFPLVGPCPRCKACRGLCLTISVGASALPYVRPDSFRYGRDPIPEGVGQCAACKVNGTFGWGMDPDAYAARSAFTKRKKPK